LSFSVHRLESERLVLEPLGPEHADELAPVLDDVSLHEFIGGAPLGVEELRARYARQARGHPTERWLNWVVRERLTGRAVGTVQATVADDGSVANLAWVIGSAFQGRGFAKEAAALMASWLREEGVRCLRAHIHPDHAASVAVARSVGLRATDVIVAGEVRWEAQCSLSR
jgi:RimJ/RimL family protein N-acetyltransferase